jgi:hypothetical protein
MSEIKISWSQKDVPSELHSMLAALSEEYPIFQGEEENSIQLQFIKSQKKGDSIVSNEKGKLVVKYAGISMAARAVGSILSGLDGEENTTFKSLGIMLDCSRNAVMTVPHLKKWLRRLSLMGYNQAMLYTEDTYKLPDEPYFGYMRGAYTENELKEVDAYAASLGIEMIACIQTLGHLGQILRWSTYSNISDTGNVMLVDCEETYNLIDKMVEMWGRVFKSRRIHVGMDETHNLGRGRFMDKFGYERGFDIFNRHLAKVSEICEKHELKPMIWSDMYFRMGNKQMDYYDKDTIIPDDVKNKIPKSVELVYWDYYHKEKSFYLEWIRKHRELGYEPLMGSGVWTWSRLWHDHKRTDDTIRPCIEACLEENVSEIFFTLWGDDGAYCEFDSALAGLCLAADLSYGGSGADEILAKRFKAICFENYKDFVTLGLLQYPCGDKDIPGTSLLWDDPLLGINWNNNNTFDPDWVAVAEKNYINILDKLGNTAENNHDDVVAHGRLIAEVLITKLKFRDALVRAYTARNRADLENIRDLMIPETSRALKRLLWSFRAQWMRRNKPFGFEVIQLRINGLIGRYEEISVRIGEVLHEKIDSIAELDEAMPKIHGGWGSAISLASGSVVI